MISGWRIKQNQVSTTGLVDTKQQPARRSVDSILRRWSARW